MCIFSIKARSTNYYYGPLGTTKAVVYWLTSLFSDIFRRHFSALKTKRRSTCHNRCLPAQLLMLQKSIKRHNFFCAKVFHCCLDKKWSIIIPNKDWKSNKNPIYMSTYSIMKNVWESDVKDNLIFDTLISFGPNHLNSENIFENFRTIHKRIWRKNSDNYQVGKKMSCIIYFASTILEIFKRKWL